MENFPIPTFQATRIELIAPKIPSELCIPKYTRKYPV
jgi:hypothetical protein